MLSHTHTHTHTHKLTFPLDLRRDEGEVVEGEHKR